MVTFDDVLPTLLRVCDRSSAFDHVKRWCAVRDLRGRVRVVVEPEPSNIGQPERQALETELQRELGRYFAPPIWSTRDERDRGHLAREVLEQASSWGPTSRGPDPITGEVLEARGQWLKLERRLSKAAWLEAGEPQPPWGLDAPMPAIVTFYSFKGGVGRTTALAACAWQLARAGRRVAVVDLDLEAPGLGTLLEVEMRRGVLDFIVDHLASGATDLDDMSAPAQIFGEDAERVEVFPAGQLGDGYLDKLARLDFVASTHAAVGSNSTSPTGSALRALIQAVAGREPRPDFVLLDSRAGLHDLGGLSLHGLAHVDVLLSRAGEQGYRGLELAVGTLARRRGVDLKCILVHALAPAKGTPEALREEPEFLARAYEIVRQRLYSLESIDENDMPQRESPEAIHSPWILRFNDELMRFTRLGDREGDLFREDFGALRGRIEELCEREAPEDQE